MLGRRGKGFEGFGHAVWFCLLRGRFPGPLGTQRRLCTIRLENVQRNGVHLITAHTAWWPITTHAAYGRVTHVLSRVFDPQERVCVYVCVCVCVCVWSVLSGLAPVLARDAFCLFERALALQGPQNCLFRNLQFALGYDFNPKERTQSVGCASLVLCVSQWILKLQQAQHVRVFACTDAMDAQHAACIVPYLFNPQKCACGVCFGWFYFLKAIITLSLHPSRSNHHHLAPHEFRVQTLHFVQA
jgi:hypothetical protein